MSRLLSIIVLSTGFSIFSLSSSLAFNYTNHYVSFSAGVSKLNEIELTTNGGYFAGDTNYVVNGAFGANITPSVRGEVEYSYREHGDMTLTNSRGIARPLSQTNHRTTVNSIMMNLYYDFDISGSRFTPFLTGGSGVSRLTSASLYNFTTDERVARDANIMRINDLRRATGASLVPTLEFLTGVPAGQAIDNVERQHDHTILSLQVGAGSSYKIDDRNSIIFGYKFFAIGHTEFGGFPAEHVNSHELYVGYKYNF